eukprot:766585-Hanusia_phi.AAC.3
MQRKRIFGSFLYDRSHQSVAKGSREGSKIAVSMLVLGRMTGAESCAACLFESSPWAGSHRPG